jgi:DNA topoisomerase-1
LERLLHVCGTAAGTNLAFRTFRSPAMRNVTQHPADHLLREHGLHYASAAELTIRRRRNGKGFIYLNGRGGRLNDQRTLYRLKRLAVPPAYRAVRFASDPRAHLQAIGQDTAGRTQYRYHPDWEKVRELRKARRLARLAEVLPIVRRWVSRHLRDREPTRERAIAAVIELVALAALRPGSETYAKQHGTRGAATLLKSDLTITGKRIRLNFVGKGGKEIEKESVSARLAAALKHLGKLPGRRMFQYRNGGGATVPLRRRDVNNALREIAGRAVSLKDFRTLIASAKALQQLSAMEPKPSERGRRRQLLTTMRAVAADLANTPAVCRKSYVHAAVVTAFESGELQRIACRAGGLRSAATREKILAKVLVEISH